MKTLLQMRTPPKGYFVFTFSIGGYEDRSKRRYHLERVLDKYEFKNLFKGFWIAPIKRESDFPRMKEELKRHTNKCLLLPITVEQFNQLEVHGDEY